MHVLVTHLDHIWMGENGADSECEFVAPLGEVLVSANENNGEQYSTPMVTNVVSSSPELGSLSVGSSNNANGM